MQIYAFINKASWRKKTYCLHSFPFFTFHFICTFDFDVSQYIYIRVKSHFEGEELMIEPQIL